jgi:6,7-dimethyl-8-ribityllumazine synthase
MVQKITDPASRIGGHPMRAHVLILEARFYEGIADMLADGATAGLTARGATSERIAVPGALEIPQVLGSAIAARAAGRMTFDGAIVLGCVIRGETAHYDIVCNNANHWVMDIATRHDVPIGNGILTVETEAQAIARATGGAAGKGGDAARACLKLIELKRGFWGQGA